LPIGIRLLLITIGRIPREARQPEDEILIFICGSLASHVQIKAPCSLLKGLTQLLNIP
jgi:hypothetical protein